MTFNIQDNEGDITVNGEKLSKQGCDSSGGFRIVGKVKLEGVNYIVKLDLVPPTSDRAYLWFGVSQCENEIRMIRKLPGEDLKYFPEILEYGYYENHMGLYCAYIVQKFEALQEFPELSLINYRVMRRLVEEYGITDLSRVYENASVTRVCNYGIREDGTVCLYDFGGNRFNVSNQEDYEETESPVDRIRLAFRGNVPRMETQLVEV